MVYTESRRRGGDFTSQRTTTREAFELFVRTKLAPSRAIDILFELVDRLAGDLAELSEEQTPEYFIEVCLINMFDAKRFKELLKP